MQVSAPPFIAPCHCGTDIDSAEEIAANNGVDSLGYLRIEDVVQLTELEGDRFCIACFDGAYPTRIPAEGQKDRFEPKIRSRR